MSFWPLVPMTFWMRILIGDGGGGGAARARSHDPCHRVRDRRGAQIFFWPDVEVPPRAKVDLATAVPNGDVGDGNRLPMVVELTSAPK